MRLVQKSGTICAGIQRGTREENISWKAGLLATRLSLFRTHPGDLMTRKLELKDTIISPWSSNGDAPFASLRWTQSQLP